MSVNFWFEHVVDAYLEACARGLDWPTAVAEAERLQGDKPRRLLTQKALASKGIPYSRQHIQKRILDGKFPPSFQLPDFSEAFVVKQREAAAIREAKREAAKQSSLIAPPE